MLVLIACEFSGVVRRAFRERGHDAWSCDFLPSDDDSEHHICGDVLWYLRARPWDLMIAHPPCTYLTYAGARYWEDSERTILRDNALRFFLNLYSSPIPRVAIENPRGWPSKAYRKQDQEINPFQFGEPIRKRVCLWLKNLPPLAPTNVVEMPEPKFCIRKSGDRAGKRYNYYFHQGKNGHARSRFFPGIAQAMAEQWGNV